MLHRCALSGVAHYCSPATCCCTSGPRSYSVLLSSSSYLLTVGENLNASHMIRSRLPGTCPTLLALRCSHLFFIMMAHKEKRHRLIPRWSSSHKDKHNLTTPTSPDHSLRTTPSVLSIASKFSPAPNLETHVQVSDTLDDTISGAAATPPISTPALNTPSRSRNLWSLAYEMAQFSEHERMVLMKDFDGNPKDWSPQYFANRVKGLARTRSIDTNDGHTSAKPRKVKEQAQKLVTCVLEMKTLSVPGSNSMPQATELQHGLWLHSIFR
jgi:hypothetical protein